MIKNREQFFKKLQHQLGVVPRKNAERACFRSANLVKNEAVKSILGGAKTGMPVTRYNPRREHVTSAPGEAPASDTGFLAQNIVAEIQVSTGIVSEVIGIVRSTAPYSAHLEFGTSAMPARPFLQPALDKNAQKIRRIFAKEGIIS